MSARFEVVRTTAGHHARFRARNGQVVWVTETYRRRAPILRAIELVTGYTPRQVDDGRWFVRTARGEIEIRDCDERGEG